MRLKSSPLARGAEDNGGAGAEPLHLLERRERFALVTHRKQTGPFEPLGRLLALVADIAVVGSIERRFETRVGGHVRVKRARKQHLTVEAHAIQVTYPRWNIRETYAAGATDLAARVRAELRHDEARGLCLLGARTEGMGCEPAFDEPAGGIIAQTGCVGDLNGARAPDGV